MAFPGTENLKRPVIDRPLTGARWVSSERGVSRTSVPLRSCRVLPTGQMCHDARVRTRAIIDRRASSDCTKPRCTIGANTRALGYVQRPSRGPKLRSASTSLAELRRFSSAHRAMPGSAEPATTSLISSSEWMSVRPIVTAPLARTASALRPGRRATRRCQG